LAKMPLAPIRSVQRVPDAEGQRRSLASALIASTIETILKRTIIRTVRADLLEKGQ
jgi:hypothetical protein